MPSVHSSYLLMGRCISQTIRSLDSLNDQIVEFVLSRQGRNEDLTKEPFLLEPSLALMKKLLLDAQGKFRRMMEENQHLASRIDGDLQNAHNEVDLLRLDLAETNRKITEMQATNCRSSNDSHSPESKMAWKPTQEKPTEKNSVEEQEFRHSKDSPFLPAKTLNGMQEYVDGRLHQEQILILRRENDRLIERNASLMKEVDDLSYLKKVMLPTEGGNAEGDLDHKATTVTLELSHLREALSVLKTDRKRLKAEKFELLNQMKQLYATLEDKETELRDFIRNYEQRMKESEETLRQLTTERDESEREKWNLLKHARQEAERAASLAGRLSIKEVALKRLEEELNKVRRHLATLGQGANVGYVRTSLPEMPTPTSSPFEVPLCTASLQTPTGSPLLLSTNGRGSSADSGVRLSSDRESTASHEVSLLTAAASERAPHGNNGDSDAASLCSSTATGASSSQYYYYYHYGIGPDAAAALPRGNNRYSTDAREERLLIGLEDSSERKDTSSCTTPVNRSGPVGQELNFNANENLSRSTEELREMMAEAAQTRPSAMTLTRKGQKSTWGSISRVFARQKKRTTVESTFDVGSDSDKRASWSPGASTCVSPLREENYTEKLRLLEEAQHIPLERWKAQTVLAWLEITLGMPQYGPMCADNIRSGKVLLALADSELESGLGITHPMHRKKLRLAIEELRDPRRRRFPKICFLTHTWVATEWLPQLGLPQYSEVFAASLVDGRLLQNMTKKDLEKQLGVSRKFHQASIINGINLLRIFRFDRQMLAEKRRQCEQVDCDPIVWTNYRFIRWAQSIDLMEYADNLKESGVHGALVVLENSFTADTMATALDIPQSKPIIRRHLITEFENLIFPARKRMEEHARYAKLERRRQEKMSSGGSLGRAFARKYATLDKNKNRASLRGSLSKAFGLQVRNELSSSRERPRSNEIIYAVPRVDGSTPQSGVCGAAFRPSRRSFGIYDAIVEGAQVRPRSSVVPSSIAEFNNKENHRRVQSIGDIRQISV